MSMPTEYNLPFICNSPHLGVRWGCFGGTGFGGRVGVWVYLCRSHSLKSQWENRARRSLRLLILNLRNTDERRSLTVSGAMFKRAAISRLVYPRHTSAVTSRSRGERDSHLSHNLSLAVYCV